MSVRNDMPISAVPTRAAMIEKVANRRAWSVRFTLTGAASVSIASTCAVLAAGRNALASLAAARVVEGET